jgi:hypothetical protein
MATKSTTTRKNGDGSYPKTEKTDYKGASGKSKSVTSKGGKTQSTTYKSW